MSKESKLRELREKTETAKATVAEAVSFHPTSLDDPGPIPDFLRVENRPKAAPKPRAARRTPDEFAAEVKARKAEPAQEPAKEPAKAPRKAKAPPEKAVPAPKAKAAKAPGKPKGAKKGKVAREVPAPRQKRPTAHRTPNGEATPRGEKVIEVVRLLCRPNGASRKELIEATGWEVAPWRWNIVSSPTSYTKRFGYKYKSSVGKEGEIRHHLVK